MKKSRVLTLGLACFLTAVTGLSTLAATSGGGGALYSHLNDTSRNETASSQKFSQTTPQNANNALNGALSPQEQLLNGTWECNPETDPIIYTTDYGLDIRWHMAGLPNDPNDIASVPSGQKFATYAYFTHADVNWVIIGCSKPSTISTGKLNLADVVSKYFNYSDYSADSIWQFFATGSSTPAGSAILNDYDTGKDEIYYTLSGTISQKDVFPNAAATDELEFDEVLCFAQNSFSAKSQFNNSTNGGQCYYNSVLMDTMNTFYNSNLTGLPIVEKTLKTVWFGYQNPINLEGTYKIFPLAGANANESFYVLNYLTLASDAMKQSSAWWLRSCSHNGYGLAYIVDTYGRVQGNSSGYTVANSLGVRPAFVLKI